MANGNWSFNNVGTTTSSQSSPAGYECPASCSSVSNVLHLHREIEQLKEQLRERDQHIMTMETNAWSEAQKFPNGQSAALRQEMFFLQDKYERLVEAHRKLLRVNQGLEDKLLKIVDKYETEKSALLQDVTVLNVELMQQRDLLAKLEQENGRYKEDMAVAIRLLQCKPSNFVAHRLDMLPDDIQTSVKPHLKAKAPSPRPEPKTIRVPISAFPPTSMIYSLNSSEEQESHEEMVSAAIMAKVLEEREKERRVDEVPNLTTNGYVPTCSCKGTENSHGNNPVPLKSSKSMPQLQQGLRIVHQGTQTYPSFIGEKLYASSCQCTNIKDPEPIKSSAISADDLIVFHENEVEASKAKVAAANKVNANASRKTRDYPASLKIRDRKLMNCDLDDKTNGQSQVRRFEDEEWNGLWDTRFFHSTASSESDVLTRGTRGGGPYKVTGASNLLLDNAQRVPVKPLMVVPPGQHSITFPKPESIAINLEERKSRWVQSNSSTETDI